MTTSQAYRKEILPSPEAAAPARTGGTPDRRARVGRARVGVVLLFLAVAATLAAGVWGVASSLGAEAEPAGVGEPVAVSGGTFVVDRSAPEHMAPMKMGGFAKQGMNMAMPQKGMDMPPEGMERFTVDVTLAAGEDGALGFSEEDFTLQGEGMGEVAPHRSALGSGEVPAGSAVSGTMNFQVPEEAENLALSFDGGRAVALDAGTGGGSSGGGSSHGGGH